MQNDILKTCCFTGHRDIPFDKRINLLNKLEETIDALYLKGITNYITGGAKGFDTMAAFAVLEKKKSNPDIKLIVISPYIGQEKGWNNNEKAEYNYVKENADEFIDLAPKYSRGSFQKRNHKMVDCSSIVVSYLMFSPSGTAQTVDYAKMNAKKIIPLGQEE